MAGEIQGPYTIVYRRLMSLADDTSDRAEAEFLRGLLSVFRAIPCGWLDDLSQLGRPERLHPSLEAFARVVDRGVAEAIQAAVDYGAPFEWCMCSVADRQALNWLWYEFVSTEAKAAIREYLTRVRGMHPDFVAQWAADNGAEQAAYGEEPLARLIKEVSRVA